jgi:hypothetical protein
MAFNPQQAIGSLNRLIGSVHVNQYPNLNVTAPFLGREGISIGFDGDAIRFIDAMTGMVTSPEPYVAATTTIHLLKTQGLSAAWKAQWYQDARIGPITVWSDTTTLGPFDFNNCGIMRVETLRFNGEDAGFVVSIRGTLYINSQMWDLFTSTVA